MFVTKRTERLLACASLVGGLMLAPALSRADFTALTDPSEIDETTLIDFEGLAFGEITDPAPAIMSEAIVLPVPDEPANRMFSPLPKFVLLWKPHLPYTSAMLAK